jgi:molecular chaperone GrpE
MTEAENLNSTPEQDRSSVEATDIKTDRLDAATEDTIESLQEQLQAALAEKEDNLRGWQRAQADYSNFRRRTEQEREELVKVAEAGLLMHLLPVVDDLERALAGLPPELRGVTWVDGVLLIDRKLRSVLEAHGLTPIDAVGQPFDPHLHEAVLRDGDPSEATTVNGELQKGYRLHDRVLRPTLVKVGPPQHQENR